MSTGSGGVEMLGKWIVGETLGEGGFSQVKLGTHSKTGVVAALKILEKKSGDSVNSSERKQVESEIDAMKKIKHRNVIQMKDFDLDMVYRKKNVILVVLELASGGELFEYLSFTGAFEEPIARSYFHQLMEGLQAAHTQGICHRDLKPENLLMDENFMLKIADFGFAHTMASTGTNLYTECGTTGYMAPEMFNAKRKGYDGALSDIWACGVILFIMIAGFPPYQKPARTDWWFDKLCKKKYDRFWMAHCRTAYFSEECKDLINKIFTVDPTARIELDDIMKHTWYTGETLADGDLSKTLAKRKRIVDLENNKLKQARQQEQEMAGFSVGTCRAIGDEEGTEEEASVDELPDLSPPSIILAMKPEDAKDDGDDEENTDDEVVDMSGEGGFDDGGIGGLTMGDTSTGTEEKKEDAPVYNPKVTSYTKFNCSKGAAEVYAGLISVLDSLSVEHEEEGYSITCKATTMQGSITFAANVFTDAEDSSASIVECQRRKGNAGAYRQQYAGIRNNMEKFASKVSTKDTVEEPEDSKEGTEVIAS